MNSLRISVAASRSAAASVRRSAQRGRPLRRPLRGADAAERDAAPPLQRVANGAHRRGSRRRHDAAVARQVCDDAHVSAESENGGQETQGAAVAAERAVGQIATTIMNGVLANTFLFFHSIMLMRSSHFCCDHRYIYLCTLLKGLIVVSEVAA